MSIFISVEKDGECWCAADRLMAWGNMSLYGSPKYQLISNKSGSLFIGTSGPAFYDHHISEFVKSHDKIISYSNEAEIFEWLQKWNADAKKLSPAPENLPSFLIVNQFGIFMATGADLFPFKCSKVMAIGAGCGFAMGVVYGLYDSALDARNLALKAAELTIEHHYYCGGKADLCQIKQSC